jgi:hypothetical protein
MNAWVVLVMLAAILFVTAVFGGVWICLELTLDERTERTPY